MPAQSLPEAFPFDGSTGVVAAMNALMAALEARFTPLEAQTNNWNSTLNTLQQAASQQVADTLRPLYEDMLGVLTLGTLFSTTSTTTANVTLGLATFIIPQSQWGIYNPPAYLAAIPADDPEAIMSGRFQSFDRTTGTLIFDVTTCIGTGVHATWSITPATPVVIPNKVDPGYYDQTGTQPLGSVIQFGEEGQGIPQPIGTY